MTDERGCGNQIDSSLRRKKVSYGVVDGSARKRQLCSMYGVYVSLGKVEGKAHGPLAARSPALLAISQPRVVVGQGAGKP